MKFRLTALLVMLLTTATSFSISYAQVTERPRAAGTAPDLAVNPSGIGEQLVLVIGGMYDSRLAAETAAAASHSEFQGFYIASSDEFELLDVYADVRPRFLQFPCNSPELAQIPELSQITAVQLNEPCDSEESVTPASSATIALDVRLDRDESSCVTGSPCMEYAFDALGDLLTWPTGTWMTASAFRTRRGAEEFMTYLTQQTDALPIAVQVLRTSGSSDIGLGQEAHPDGSGPLTSPLPDQALHQ